MSEHRPRRWRRFVIAGILAAAAAPLGAATYHISSSVGQDANPGTEAQPWQTLAHVNAAVFSPGDQVLFRRGDTWSGTTLAVSSSGSANAPIVYGAYGEGAKPVLGLGDRKSEGILISGKRHLVVQDFDVRGGFGGVRCVANSAHVELLRIDVADCGGAGITLRQSSHVLVDGCTVRRAGNCGILMHGSAEKPKVNHCTVQNCVVSDLRTNDGIIIHQDSRGNGAGAHFVFRRNVSFNNPEQGFDITAGSDVLVEDNVSHDNRGGAFDISHVSHHVTVRRHHSFDEPRAGSTSLRISSPFVTVEHSRFVGPAEPAQGKTVALISLGPGSESQAEDVVLRHNVFAWNSPAPGHLFRLSNNGVAARQAALERLTMQNNLFVSRTAAGGRLVVREAVHRFGSAGFVIDRNLYFAGAPGAVSWTVDGRTHDFAGYRATCGHEAHGLEADPRFVDFAAGDFHLRADSPAIDAGTDVGLARDADGAPISQGKAPDLGAYEFATAVQSAR